MLLLSINAAIALLTAKHCSNIQTHLIYRSIHTFQAADTGCSHSMYSSYTPDSVLQHSRGLRSFTPLLLQLLLLLQSSIAIAASTVLRLRQSVPHSTMHVLTHAHTRAAEHAYTRTHIDTVHTESLTAVERSKTGALFVSIGEEAPVLAHTIEALSVQLEPGARCTHHCVTRIHTHTATAAFAAAAAAAAA
jgi:hypothetical protein